MLIDEALNLGRILLDKHGLYEWQIVATDEAMVNRTVVGYILGEVSAVPIEIKVQVLARCVRPIQTILLSGPVVLGMSILGVREMILHEIAHALTDGEHDEAWTALAKMIGCTGREQIDPRHYAEQTQPQLSGEEATA